MNSVHRIILYLEQTPNEAPYFQKQDKKSWPQKGNFVGKNVRFRYRQDKPEIIHGLNFDFAQNEKIGIIGRTGSGKSTLTLGFLRILELSEDENVN